MDCFFISIKPRWESATSFQKKFSKSTSEDSFNVFHTSPSYISVNSVKAPLGFVRRSGPDFFSSLAADSKPLVFLWITKNLNISQPFLKARQIGISRLLN